MNNEAIEKLKPEVDKLESLANFYTEKLNELCDKAGLLEYKLLAPSQVEPQS